MADVGKGRIPFTPTPARGTGDAERLSSHRADDVRVDEGFDRDILKRQDLYRVLNNKHRGKRRGR